VRLQNNNLLDIRFAKIFKIGGARLEALADVYNLLNSNATTSEVTHVGSAPARTRREPTPAELPPVVSPSAQPDRSAADGDRCREQAFRPHGCLDLCV